MITQTNTDSQVLHPSTSEPRNFYLSKRLKAIISNSQNSKQWLLWQSVAFAKRDILFLNIFDFIQISTIFVTFRIIEKWFGVCTRCLTKWSCNSSPLNGSFSIFPNKIARSSLAFFESQDLQVSFLQLVDKIQTVVPEMSESLWRLLHLTHNDFECKHQPNLGLAVK